MKEEAQPGWNEEAGEAKVRVVLLYFSTYWRAIILITLLQRVCQFDRIRIILDADPTWHHSKNAQDPV